MKYKLNVINKSRDLVKKILELTKEYKEFQYTINPQIIRASLSVGSNIIEGTSRTNKGFINFLNIAIGSCRETMFQLEFYKNTENLQKECDIIIAMIYKLKQNTEHRARNTETKR